MPPPPELIQRTATRLLGFELREPQLRAVQAVLAGCDTLVVLPTGAGKSAIYQVAGALIPGPTVVVSPLIALQQDQIAALETELSTAAPPVRRDIVAALGLRDPDVVLVAGFNRPELHLTVRMYADESTKRRDFLQLAAQAKGTGIVYAATRKQVEELVADLAAGA